MTVADLSMSILDRAKTDAYIKDLQLPPGRRFVQAGVLLQCYGALLSRHSAILKGFRLHEQASSLAIVSLLANDCLLCAVY